MKDKWPHTPKTATSNVQRIIISVSLEHQYQFLDCLTWLRLIIESTRNQTSSCQLVHWMWLASVDSYVFDV